MSDNEKELPKIRVWKKDEMKKRIAFFKDLKGSKKGLPDSLLPECTRELINVIGFEPPKGTSKHVSPLGDDNSQMPAINISEGFNLGFCRCKPGKGPLMHNHDTNVFIGFVDKYFLCSSITAILLGNAPTLSLHTIIHIINYPKLHFFQIQRFCHMLFQ